MIGVLLSKIVILLFGVLYPAYASYKAVKTKNVKEYVKWMMYWIVFAFYTSLETLADVFLTWLPFYYEIKLVFVLWLISPVTKGASILYRRIIHPQLLKHEEQIDMCISIASKEGYAALWNYGGRFINYLAEILLKATSKVSRNHQIAPNDETDGEQYLDLPESEDAANENVQNVERPSKRRVRPPSVRTESID